MEMNLQCLEILMLMACATSALPTDAVERNRIDANGCRRCPPGQYQAGCTVCSICPSGYYTSDWNSEVSCLPCFRDCRKVFNLQVVQECSPKSDVQCICIDGFTCKYSNSVMKQCIYCHMGTSPPPTSPPALLKNQTGSSETICEPGTFLNVSSGNCEPEINEPTTDTPSHSPDTGNRLPWGWWVGLLFFVLLLITPAIFFGSRSEGTCLKQFFKLCSDGGHKGEEEAGAHPPDVAAGQLFSREAPWDAKTMTNPNKENHTDLPNSMDQAPKASGNFGPFHIYSAGAVFVSLLNHFTNPEGETEGVKTQKEDIPPPPSPPVHLSEEERDAQKDCIFFPLQEQGKESHLSKEEEIYCQPKEK
ncbi:tumor necrosis factor receptor superfamily member 3 [Conger conger]|nr:tumor necrosis factor receptor superfamily member 3 [Conger conger]